MSSRVFHPYLFCAYPILFLYAQNVEYVAPIQIVGPLLVAFALTLVGSVAGSYVLRDHRKAGIAVSVAAIVFFSYGHLWHAFAGTAVGPFMVGRHAVLLPAAIVLGGVGIFAAARIGPSAGDVTRILNVVGAALVVLVLVPIGGFLSREGLQVEAAPEIVRAGQPEEGAEGRLEELKAELHAQIDDSGRAEMRDIYYLMPDRYGAEWSLREIFDFDNSEFVDSLRDRGFYVADESLSNYPTTTHSLSASFSMTYLDILAEQVGEDSGDRRHLHRVMQRPLVGSLLRELGYEYHHIGAWWDPTAESRIADVNYRYSPHSEFVSALQETTVLLAVGRLIGNAYDRFDHHRLHYNEVRFQFDTLHRLAGEPGPKFVFAHILSPHDPFSFNADGSYRTEEEAHATSYEENFIAQALHVNDRFEELIDALLERPEEEQPIIIIQADEGPHPHRALRGFEHFDPHFVWGEASDDELALKFPILNAIYVPGAEDAEFYPELSPVNVFRAVFNAHFETELELLEDRSYIFPDFERLYRFIDVTERVRGSRG